MRFDYFLAFHAKSAPTRWPFEPHVRLDFRLTCCVAPTPNRASWNFRNQDTCWCKAVVLFSLSRGFRMWASSSWNRLCADAPPGLAFVITALQVKNSSEGLNMDSTQHIRNSTLVAKIATGSGIVRPSVVLHKPSQP